MMKIEYEDIERYQGNGILVEMVSKLNLDWDDILLTIFEHNINIVVNLDKLEDELSEYEDQSCYVSSLESREEELLDQLSEAENTIQQMSAHIDNLDKELEAL